MTRSFSIRMWFSAVASVVLLAACATGPQIMSQADPSTDFGQYKTWGFYSPIAMESSGYSNWMTERIRADVRQQMDARGYRYAEADPDLLVNFQGAIKDKTQVWNDPMPTFGPYWGYRSAYIGVPGWYNQVDVEQYKEGTLTVDLVDARRNLMVWTGVAKGEVTDQAQAKQMTEIDAAIAKIFAAYPYQAGSSQPVQPAKK